ncbi:MAG: hypothetical protein EAZ84_13180 [Verrucomicrobia bacterium]|nr:MAG: hypothetical protein EAZ84_13180 [Verrucomicrobiota bacterium]
MQVLIRGQKATLATFGQGTAAPHLPLGFTLDMTGQPKVDVCWFNLDELSRSSDERYFMFSHQPQSPCESIAAPGASGNARQVFAVEFSKLPPTARRLIFTLTMEGAASMPQITRGAVRLPSAGGTFAELHSQGEDYSDEKALMLAETLLEGRMALRRHRSGLHARAACTAQAFQRRGGGGTKAETCQTGTAAACTGTCSRVCPATGVAEKTHARRAGRAQVDPPRKRRFPERDPYQSQLLLACEEVLLRRRQASRSQPEFSLSGPRRQESVHPGHGRQIRQAQRRPQRIARQGRPQRRGFRRGEFIRHAFQPDRAGASLHLHPRRRYEFRHGERPALHERVGSVTLIRLDAPRSVTTFCAVCLISRTASGVDIVREAHYFEQHRDPDQHYVFGSQRTRGSK